MAVIDPPLFLQGDSHPARSVRAIIAEMYDEGVMNLSAFKVTQRASGGANYSVDVAAGRLIIEGTNVPFFQGNYLVINDAVVNLVPTSVPSPGNTRIDSVCAQVRDNTEDAGGINDARVYIKAGTPTTGTPAAPTLDANAIRLANILIADSTTTITDAAITDTRLLAGRRGLPGTLEWHTGNVIPTGWIEADGVDRLRADFPDLHAAYQAMSYPYGAGNGSTTFGIPNLRGKLAIPRLSGQAQVDTIGETGGEYTHALTTAELAAHTHTGPSHTHPFTGSTGVESTTHVHAVSGGAFAVVGGSGGALGVGSSFSHQNNTDGQSVNHTHSVSGTTDAAGTGATGSTGSGTAHNVMQPYQVIGLAVIRT